MMPVSGVERLVGRLRRVSNVGAAMDKWANDGAATVAQEARDLVNEGGIPSPNHVVSRPGQPPNTDTGYLQSRIQPQDLPDVGHAAAISDAEYALALEFGTQIMVERPYMRVAASNKRKALLDAARKAVGGVVRG